MRGLFQATAIERHQALIAAHVRPLVDRHRHVALAEQAACALHARQPRGVVARIGAQPVGRLKIHHHERDRAIGLGLQDEATLELQGRAAQIEFGDLERQHRVVDRNLGWGTNRAVDGHFGVGGFGCHGVLSGVGAGETKGLTRREDTSTRRPGAGRDP